MALLQIKTDTDFAKDLLSDVQTIVFTNGVAGATGLFHHSQVNDIQIKFEAEVIGNANPNHLNFSGGAVELKYFTFSTWDNSVDSITINGSNSSENLGGSSQDDVISGLKGNDTLGGYAGADILIGGAGKDKMYGGGDNDEFWFTADLTVNDVVAGELINGGGGTDTILVMGSNNQNHDFRSATLSSIEVLQFGSTSLGGVNVLLNGSQIGVAGGITQVNNMGLNELFVSGTLVDLSSVVFGTALPSFVSVSVSEVGLVADNASLTGSTSRDYFRPNTTGTLTILAGDGDDYVTYTDSNGGAGHSIDGGDGFDTLAMGSSIDQLDLTQFDSVTNIESLQFNLNAYSKFVINETHLTVPLEIYSNFFIVSEFVLNMESGGTIDLSGTSFLAWEAGSDIIRLNGTASGDQISGSFQNDIINGKGAADTLYGSYGDDVIRGGGGGDNISGGFGRDVLTGNGGNDTFVFNYITESPDAAGRDRITDFVQGEDEVDVSAIAAFTFIGGAAFDGSGNAELRFVQNAAGTFTTVHGDSDGNGVVDFQIGFNGAFTLTAADFGL